jgi:hypothetical protein
MYRAERKAKRVAKIKSKAYRRIHRKAVGRVERRERSLLLLLQVGLRHLGRGQEVLDGSLCTAPNGKRSASPRSRARRTVGSTARRRSARPPAIFLAHRPPLPECLSVARSLARWISSRARSSSARRRIHRKAKEREAAGGPQMTLEDLAELDAIDGGNRERPYRESTRSVPPRDLRGRQSSWPTVRPCQSV